MLSVRGANVAAQKEENHTEPQASAHIVDSEQPVEAPRVRYPKVSGVPAVPSEANSWFAVTPTGEGSIRANSDDTGADGCGDT